ncbi:MAG: hypothetical protein RR495_03830 [Anaerovoracaceae bacterium]
MKNLITTMACLTILLIFVLQFTSNQVIHNHLSNVEKEINSFQQIVKKEGYVSISNQLTLQNSIAEILDCSNSEISVSGDKVPLSRGSKIKYAISLSLEDLMVASNFWNLSPEEETNRFTINQTTISELIDRSSNW